MKPPCCQANRHWTPLVTRPLNLWPRSPITVNLDWVKRGQQPEGFVAVRRLPLLAQNDELPDAGEVKRAPSLSELPIHHNGWLVRYDSLSLFHVAADSFSSAPHHLSITHGLSCLETTLDNLTPGEAASLRWKILKLSCHLPLSEEQRTCWKGEDYVVP